MRRQTGPKSVGFHFVLPNLRALRHLTLLNPLTYGIDAFKHVLLRNGTPPLGPEFPLYLDLSLVTAISLVMLTLAALSFRRKE